MNYSPLDDAMLDHQSNEIDPENDRSATVVVASWAGAMRLAETRAAYFGQRQQVGQIRNYRMAQLRLALAWSVSAA